MSILTSKEVLEIRKIGFTMETKELAEMFNVSYQLINDVLHYRVHTDLDPKKAKQAQNTMPLRSVKKRQLTEWQVLEILTNPDMSNSELSKLFEVSYTSVKLIRERKMYKDVAILENRIAA